MCYGDLAKNTINRSNKIPIQLHFDTKESLSKELCNGMQANDVILLKGSRSMKLDLIIKDIINYVK
jgi:UDP-N-acetylmuramoyl-tripeptide--D-alanyl-D-alanine ligase